MREYAVIYEHGSGSEENWGAYVPDLPGCVSTGETFEEVQRNIREAIRLHLEGLKAEGLPIPEPRSHGELVAAAGSQGGSDGRGSISSGPRRRRAD